MLLFLLTVIAWAQPSASATLAADGHYTLVLRPEEGWEAAELTVAGGGSMDFDEVAPNEPVVVEGWTDRPGPLRLTLTSVDKKARGTIWMFEVEPFRVPVETPHGREVAQRNRGPK